MPSWLPGDDYMTNFKVGDPYVGIDDGYARLPGAGYEALHPELKGLSPEDYPDIHKLRILGDVAPYSREYNQVSPSCLTLKLSRMRARPGSATDPALLSARAQPARLSCSTQRRQARARSRARALSSGRLWRLRVEPVSCPAGLSDRCLMVFVLLVLSARFASSLAGDESDRPWLLLFYIYDSDLFWPGMEVDMELDSMLLFFGRRVPFFPPRAAAPGARRPPLAPHSVPAIALKLEPCVATRKSCTER